MDFGSEFILADDGDDLMEVTDSDDEYDDDDEGVAGFECEIMDMDGGPVDDDPPVKGERKSITTNTLKIELAKIDEAPDQNLAENFATKCNNPECGAFFSDMDQWNKTDNGHTWKCKFCDKEHPLPAGFEEKLKNLPTKYDVCYEHADPPAIPIKDYKIIFVIDISGSMGRPMQVPKKEGTTLHKLWIESQDQKATDPNKDPNTSDPNNDPNKVQEGIEVTWLQTVQATVIDLIQEMSVNQPERRIGLVTFHDIVTIHKEQKTDLVGADLDNKATALFIGETNSNLEPVSKTKENITASLRGLADGGRTALGPALLVALGMVKDSRGSRIIVCTDGASNIGIGKLEEGPSKEDEKFYQQLTNKAILAGASISIISFDRCELKVLEKLARNTGGTLDIVQPTDLEKPIRDELSKETIATNVMVTFLVNKALYVNDKNRDGEKNTENKSSVSPVIGNVTKTGKQIVCFEFAFRNPSQVKPPQQQLQLQQPQTMGQNCNSCNPSCQPNATSNAPSQNLAILGVNTTPIQPEYPFQIQITYKDREDRTLTRVWTKNCPITKSRDVAQKGMNPDVTVASFVQKSAKEILEQRQKIQHSELKRRATNLINEAKSHKINDNISSNQELLKKLDTLIETLEELAVSGLSDEVSAVLSGFAGQS